jgi:hypothetical protein
MDISIEELQLFINASMSGFGEGCSDCHKAIMHTTPSILTRHMSVLVEDKNKDFIIKPANEFFVGSILEICKKAYEKVYGTSATIEKITKVFNYINVDHYEYFTSPRDDEFILDILIKNFENYRNKISNN